MLREVAGLELPSTTQVVTLQDSVTPTERTATRVSQRERVLCQGNHRGLEGTQEIFHLTLSGLQSHVVTVLIRRLVLLLPSSASPRPGLGSEDKVHREGSGRSRILSPPQVPEPASGWGCGVCRWGRIAELSVID